LDWTESPQWVIRSDPIRSDPRHVASYIADLRLTVTGFLGSANRIIRYFRFGQI